MPFTWKKKNRFSRLVTDHHHLVVETGFPTSLIDLYVRNRGRFRKSDVMKPWQNISPSPSPSSGLLIDSVNLSSSCSSFSLLDSNNSSSGCYDYKENNEIIEEEIDDLNSSEIHVERSVKLAKSNSSSSCYDYKENNEVIENSSEIDVENSVKLAKSNSLSSCTDYTKNNEIIEEEIEDLNSSEIEVEKSVELTKLNPIFVVLLKVLIMLVLVIGTKRFTFGITLSAFLLFLLESVRKPLIRRSSLVDSKTPIESSFREKKASLVKYSEVMEIEEVESKMEVRSEKELDEVRSEELMEVRRKSSRRAVMKSRMKKLVPKKLRRSSMGSKGEMSCEFKEDETVKPLVFSSRCSDSKGENLSVLKQEYDEIVEIKKRSSSLTYSSEIYCNDNKLRIESQQNCGYLVLCLIVLVGLIGGRVLALSLALSWCLMLKMLQWRNVKFIVS